MRAAEARFRVLFDEFRSLYSELYEDGDRVAAREWYDAATLLARSGQVGLGRAPLMVAASLEHFVEAAEAGDIEDVPERIVEINRRILRTVRDRLTADERAEVDEMVSREFGKNETDLSEW